MATHSQHVVELAHTFAEFMKSVRFL